MARFLVFTLLLVTQLAFSQAAGFQFIENKNQWPSQVAYKADLRSGYLYLERNGFRVNKKKEFFNISVQEAKSVVKRIGDPYKMESNVQTYE